MERPRPKGRGSRGGAGRHVNQYKITSETVGKKLDVINHLASSKKMRATIARFYPSLAAASYNSKRTTILRWARNRSSLEAAMADSKAEQRKLRGIGIGTILSDENELEIACWVDELRGDGIPVSTLMLTDKAKDVAEEAGISDFKASDKWVNGFKRRHKFSFRCPTRQSQITPANLSKIAAEFAAEVEATVRDLGITRVYNADQTAVFFEYVAKKTLSRRGKKTVWVKCSGASKERATVMLLGDSDGNRCMPFVIFKVKPSKDAAIQEENNERRCGFGVRNWSKVRKIRHETGLEVYGNAKGWWNSALSIEFLKYHFAARVPQEPILLLWDDFSGHWSPCVKEYASSIKVFLLKVPPHATPVSQPADVAWNFPLKSRLRNYWHEDMQTQIKNARRPSQKFKLKRPNRDTICKWVKKAWEELPTDTIANGFRASGLLPSENCIASAGLIADLEKLSLLEGAPVDEGQEFDLNDIIAETVV